MPIPIEEIDNSDTICFGKLAIKAGFTPKKILNEYKLIAFSDPADHVEISEGGELRFIPLQDQGRKRRAIKTIKEKTVITESQDGKLISKTSTVDFTLHDKLAALDVGVAIHGMKKAAKVDVTSGGQVIGFDSIPAAEREALMALSRGIQADLDAANKSQ